MTMEDDDDDHQRATKRGRRMSKLIITEQLITEHVTIRSTMRDTREQHELMTKSMRVGKQIATQVIVVGLYLFRATVATDTAPKGQVTP